MASVLGLVSSQTYLSYHLLTLQLLLSNGGAAGVTVEYDSRLQLCKFLISALTILSASCKHWRLQPGSFEQLLKALASREGGCGVFRIPVHPSPMEPTVEPIH